MIYDTDYYMKLQQENEAEAAMIAHEMEDAQDIMKHSNVLKHYYIDHDNQDPEEGSDSL